MVQYIDKAALVAEIERRRDLHYKYYMKNGAGSIAECKYDEDRQILSFLDTLEVKEVDVDKEIDIYYNIEAPKEFENVLYQDIEKFAKHFFELGIKAKDIDVENSFNAIVCKIGSIYLKEMDKDAIVKALESYKDGDKVKIIIKAAQKGE